MSFYNFIRNEQSGADELHIDGEIVSNVDWFGPSGQVVARRFRQRLAQCGDVTVYINSPGGSVTAGLAILDTMDFIKCDVSTICLGECASMAAVLLSNGAKGKRLCLPNSMVLIHQPSGGAQGQQTEIAIVADFMLKTRNRLNKILADNTGQTLETIQNDTERDNYMTAEEAVAYGLVDRITTSRAVAPSTDE